MDEKQLSIGARSTSPINFALYAFLESSLIRWFAKMEVGCLSLTLPSGRQEIFGQTDASLKADLRIHSYNLVPRIILNGDTGFAESYMAGEWDSNSIADFMTLIMRNIDRLRSQLAPSQLSRLVGRVRHATRGNSRIGSRRNIAAHYDLGNDFYRHWLDRSMTYSSALFEHPQQSLFDAQQRKYQRVGEVLDLRSSDRLLEIGCGWGGFAEYAAKRFGCRTVCLTLSREQAAYARDRMQKAGLGDLVEIRIQDYRDISEQFDKVASIEMFEAVGERHWPTFFQALTERLAPNGKACLQTITIAEHLFDDYRRTPDFIQRYIFPGGMLPSVPAFRQAANAAGLTIDNAFFFGNHYAETLRQWNKAFLNRWPMIKALGFDERFRRMWHYYLCYSEVGFDTNQIDVGQFTLQLR